MGAIVLAGGRSSRMGQDKALLPFGGATLLSHVVGIVRQVAEPVIVVADVADKYQATGASQVLGDRYPAAGPLGGIITGLDALESGYHFVVACDMPYLQPEVLHLLMRFAGGYQAAVPCIDGRLEPLCAVYHRACRPTLRGFLRRKEYAMHQAVKALSLHTIAENELRRLDPDLRTFTNLNTLDEYDRSDASG